MAEMNEDVLTALEKTMPHCLATVSARGEPNVILLTYLKALDAETVIIADNKFDKTRSNLDANPKASFVVFDRDSGRSFQVKGSVTCYTAGKEYQDCIAWVHVKHPQMTPKAVFYMKVEEIYCGADKIA